LSFLSLLTYRISTVRVDKRITTVSVKVGGGELTKVIITSVSARNGVLILLLAEVLSGIIYRLVFCEICALIG
jgi:hypothetical protein